MKIVLLEDDLALNRVIKKVLELDEHSVETYADGKTLLGSLCRDADLYILDINVPHVSGLELLDIIVGQDRNAKVIIISVNIDIDSLQEAYRLGCVDYLKKPFHIEELRIKIGRLQEHKKDLLSGVRTRGDSVTFTKKEKRFLLLLLENLGQVISYREIDEHVYIDKQMTMDALRAMVLRLRAKLSSTVIHNVLDEGYMISKIGQQEESGGVYEKMRLLEKQNSLLKLEKNLLLKKSTTDMLTGLYNRAKIHEVFDYEQKQSLRYGDSLSLIILDLDDFKSINDQYGHNTGDDYLRELGRVLKLFFRSVDSVGRWGGEEFIVLLPGTTLAEARAIAIKLREKINAIGRPKIGYKTASYGIAALGESDTLDSVVYRADKALYLAKANGKDQIEG